MYSDDAFLPLTGREPVGASPVIDLMVQLLREPQANKKWRRVHVKNGNFPYSKPFFFVEHVGTAFCAMLNVYSSI